MTEFQEMHEHPERFNLSWPKMGFDEWRKLMEESHCGECGEGVFTEEDGRCDVCGSEPK